MTIDPALPGDDDIVSQHPPQARAMRTALRNDHDANGRHIQVSFTNRTGSPPAGLADHVTMWQEDGVLFQRVGLATATAMGVTPVGGIIMWSGTLVNIPSGWALCDGTAGTPDLRDKFVRGAAPAADPGATGGADTIPAGVTGSTTLTAAQSGLPDHVHPEEGVTPVSESSGGGEPRFIGQMQNTGGVVGGARNATQGHTHPTAVVSLLPTFFALAFIMFTG